MVTFSQEQTMKYNNDTSINNFIGSSSPFINLSILYISALSSRDSRNLLWLFKNTRKNHFKFAFEGWNLNSVIPEPPIYNWLLKEEIETHITGKRIAQTAFGWRKVEICIKSFLKCTTDLGDNLRGNWLERERRPAVRAYHSYYEHMDLT